LIVDPDAASRQVLEELVRSAGYDVASVTVCDGYAIPRYIEVKAVSAADYGFFWTANEVRVARALAACYFLYLVPVGFDAIRLDSLLIIQDPNAEILRSGGAWAVADNVLSCRLSEPSGDCRTEIAGTAP